MSLEQQQPEGGRGASEDAGVRTLEEVKYVIGDWIDVAVFNNNQGGGPPRGFEGPRGGGFDGPRSGGFSRGGGPERGRGEVEILIMGEDEVVVAVVVEEMDLIG